METTHVSSLSSLQKRWPIRLIIFDLDDTLIYAVQDPSVGEDCLKFMPIPESLTPDGPERVVDGPGRVQVLMKHARVVLRHLYGLGITLTWASMGPEWQMRRFARAFKIDSFFDWELGSYDRRDKGEKVELCIQHYNDRLLSEYPFNNPPPGLLLKREEVLFVDDNLGYLARVDSYMEGVKVLWAHYRTGDGMLDFFRDLEEQYEISLPRPYLSE